MKKLFLLLTACIPLNPILNAGNVKTVSSKIDHVIVFLDGAQVFRKAKISIPKGISTIVFDSLSSKMNPSSIQVTGQGNYTILEVKYEIHYPGPDAPKTLPTKIIHEIHFLEDSIETANYLLEELVMNKQALEQEKLLLAANKIIRGEGHSDTMPVLREAMAYYRQQMKDINKALMNNKIYQSKGRKALLRMQNRLALLKNYNAHHGNTDEADKSPSHQVLVSISADAAVNGFMQINYMVQNAGWSPKYDLRASDIQSPVSLTYNANVYQNTGIDWTGVKLTLSTANPNQNNNKPVMPVWYINYYMAIKAETSNLWSEKEMALADTQIRTSGNAMLPDAMTDYASISATIGNFEFAIKQVYDIPADGINHTVAVLKKNLNANYYYYLVPKYDQDAFLMAKLTGWEELSLLPGSVNIYYAGTYIGKTSLNPMVLNDTLELSLGRDKNISSKRTKVKDKEKDEIIGNNRKKTITYELTFRNNKSMPVKLFVEDQIPVALSNEIKVALINDGGANFDNDSGFLRWRINLGAKDQQKLTFTYSIKYDSDKNLLGNL